jgi:hypothetical protein
LILLPATILGEFPRGFNQGKKQWPPKNLFKGCSGIPAQMIDDQDGHQP